MNNVPHVPIMYNETNIEGAAAEIAYMANEIRLRPAPPDPGKYAACKFCGQFVTIPAKVMETFESIDDVVEYATIRCECAKARFYVSEKNRREQAEAARQFALMEAEEAIAEKFGSYSDLDSPVSPEVLKMLLELAALVYDGKIGNFSATVSGKTKALISRTSKGKLRIDKNYSDTDRTEIG